MAKRVLVLDDDLAVLEAIETALTYENYEVFTVGHTYNIFKTIDDYKPDIILIDYILGGATGGELCKAIKRSPQTAHIPVIIISAYQGSIEALRSFGCDHFIPKPFDLSTLYQGIDMVLDHNKIKI